MAATYDKSAKEAAKHRRYCQEQRELLRKLEDLAASERTMYELDNAKDQVMTVCKVALANLAMWVRDQYFPAAYTRPGPGSCPSSGCRAVSPGRRTRSLSSCGPSTTGH